MSTIPPGRKVVWNRWALTEKYDGALNSSTVAQGFSQVLGKDFTVIHAPIVTNLAFHLSLIMCVFMRHHTGKFEI
jgi:hypothetical protein